MTALTYVLGSVSLRILRAKHGRAIYWAWSGLIALAFCLSAKTLPLGIAFLSLVILVGVFCELEELGLNFLWSAFFTLLISSLISGGAFALWVSRVGPKWLSQILAGIDSLLKLLPQMGNNMQIQAMDLVLQIPSIALILWMSSLYLAVLLEGRLEPAKKTATENAERPTMRAQLMQLRMPDVVVWGFILALLGAFGGFDKNIVEPVSINVLNVSFVLFFFQGIAVVARFFERLKMGPFWQLIFMVLVIVHLFLFVSLLGLIDYWFNFRARLDKRPQEFNSEV